jgi:ATP-dependent DNA helicase DinG
LAHAPEFRRELGAQIEQLEGLLNDLETVVALADEEYVYWLEGTNLERAWCEACSAPIDISDLLRTQVFERKRTVVLTSATLAVADSFDFLGERLGVKDLDERFASMEAGTPFDFENQVLALATPFLPPPNSDGFTESLARLLAGVFEAAGGRSLVLFTSYAMLKDVLARIEPELKRSGLTVIAQGRDGSRQLLLETLAGGERVVLFGTSSFWEGVDVKGEALSCLVLARLPFQVYTDPVFEARRELISAGGGNDFYDYSVPCAVLKLKQGFGRLIRSKTDRGVVLIADSRILKKSYGRVFLRSLPSRLRVAPDERSTIEAVGAFLEREVTLELPCVEEEEWASW